ncbi:hypothetical protein CEXT_286001 [Caerostris extrusa]|uniref:Uncharacterized protein n=1 Tax=Caerostris extrusa TaxID=172846 RepID=A0AAV4SLM8_CAEEX|nr:hypothetical protein CEXT_286001 [Caerostris extrusa]
MDEAMEVAIKVNKEQIAVKRKRHMKQVLQKREEKEPIVWKWVGRTKGGGGIKWQTLSQNGPIFTPARVRNHARFYYSGKPMQLIRKLKKWLDFMVGCWIMNTLQKHKSTGISLKIREQLEEQKVGGGIKWQTLSHNGPIFTPARVRNHDRFYYSGKPMQLSKKA